MARELSQILQELNSVYDPQRNSYNQQIGGLDPQLNAEQQGLDAAKTDSFNQITTQANRRGLFYSGVPIQEQAQYTGANYLPAVANLRSRYAQQKFNLQDAIGKINEEQYNKAYDVRHGEQQLDLQRQLADEAAARDVAASRAAAKGGGGGVDFGGGGGGAGAPSGGGGGYNLSQRKGGGFNFQGPSGQGISAAQYSQSTGIPFRDLLQQMANAGDAGAKTALGLVGNDYGFNKSKVGNQQQVNILRSLGINAGNYRGQGAGAQRGGGGGF